MPEQEKEFSFNMKYFDELKKSMEYLGSKKDTLFIGQAVEVPGTAMSNTLKNINKKKLLELPVAEDMQMGMTLGLAMDKNVPISIYPRWNFLLYGINQLINHVDKFNIMCGNEIIPKITKTAYKELNKQMMTNLISLNIKNKTKIIINVTKKLKVTISFLTKLMTSLAISSTPPK